MKAIIYRRISTNDRLQDIDRQLKPIEAYCKDKELEIIGDFQDKVSGTVPTHKRKGYTEMMDLVSSYPNPKELNIVFDEISRLGRKRKIILSAIETFTDRGINVHFISPECVMLDKDGNINELSDTTITIFAQLAQNERNRIAHRVKTSIDRTASAEKTLGGIVTYGYTTNDQAELKIDPIESKHVEDIFKRYITGSGATTISTYLNNKKITTKTGKQWMPSQVLKLLQNRQYIGERKIKGEIYSMPSIIHSDIFEQAERIRTSKARTISRVRKNINPLVGIISCGCGSTIMVNRSSNKNLRYVCNRSFKIERCGQFFSIDYKLLINSLYSLFEKIVGDSNNNKELILKLQQETQQILEITNPNLQHLIDDSENQKKRYDVMFEKGRLSEQKYFNKLDEADKLVDERNTQIQANKERIEQIKKQINSLESEDSKDSIIDINTFKHFIQTHISKIRIIRISKPNALQSLFKRENETVFKINVETVTEISFEYFIGNYTKNKLAYVGKFDSNDYSIEAMKHIKDLMTKRGIDCVFDEENKGTMYSLLELHELI